jgi:hypothetical protein
MHNEALGFWWIISRARVARLVPADFVIVKTIFLSLRDHLPELSIDMTAIFHRHLDWDFANTRIEKSQQLQREPSVNKNVKAQMTKTRL